MKAGQRGSGLVCCASSSINNLLSPAYSLSGIKVETISPSPTDHQPERHRAYALMWVIYLPDNSSLSSHDIISKSIATPATSAGYQDLLQRLLQRNLGRLRYGRRRLTLHIRR